MLPLIQLLLTFVTTIPALSQTESQTSQRPGHLQVDERIELKTGLLIEPVGRYGRAPFHTDPIAAAIARGEFDWPREGESVTSSDGRARAWQLLHANADGWFRHRALRGGYLAVNVKREEPGVMLLDARGHSMVYVNGEPRGGDVYNLGLTILPVHLRAGENQLLFQISRGEMRGALIPAPDSGVMFDLRDGTWPTPIAGERDSMWGALLLINAGAGSRDDLMVVASASNAPPEHTEIGWLEDGFTRKVPVRLPAVPGASAGSRVEYTLRLISRAQPTRTLAETTVTLAVASLNENHTRTFISRVDGSVQYFAVRPPVRVSNDDDAEQAGMILSLHGASVEGAGMRDQYAAKEWATVVAPTNRRPYGFDWEDWGRIDAMEVLEHARARYRPNPSRTWLTGHSMGGHGTWQIGAHFPDQFAAIGPSAGWTSFWSYTGAERFDESDPIQVILKRAVSPSDTLALKENFAMHGVYILHGDADDNVPVTQARAMVKELAAFHPDFAYREIAGAGHWWGRQCCDWPAMMDFFRDRSIPASQDVRHIRFATATPGINAVCHGMTIWQQQKSLVPSRVDVHYNAEQEKIVGTTENVQLLRFDLSNMPGPINQIELDGVVIQDLPASAKGDAIWLNRRNELWGMHDAPLPAMKSPSRSGLFKSAFDHKAILVYGTHGNEPENSWSRARARFDAETFAYRGNGAFRVMPDRMFDPDVYADRNVILYGNADTNSAWGQLLADSPIQVHSGRITIGEKDYAGDDLAAMFVQPRLDSGHAVVGAISGTGLVGSRATDRLPMFVSGVAYPDWIVFDVTTLSERINGVRAAGFFGNDWHFDESQSAFRE